MDGHIKISVIVPIYNIKGYIKRCVDSIVNQTYSNLEIILVDDGSTDGSGVLCDRFSEQDQRIIAIHKQNGGLADARNVGLDKATGQVISFIDGDDYVDYRMYEIMLNALADNISMVVCGMIIQDVNGVCLSSNVWNATHNVHLSNEECIYAFLKEGHNGFDLSCCNKIFRKELFENIRFTKGLVGEDTECLYRVLDNVVNCVCVNQCLYIYAGRTGSITRSGFSEKQMDYISIAQQVREAIERKYPKIKVQAYNFELRWLMQCWNLVQNADDREVRKKWEKEIRERVGQNLCFRRQKLRKSMGNYSFIISYAILFRCDKAINKGFLYWFRCKDAIKYYVGN